MWSDAESAVLAAILDELIPPNPRRSMPGAGELGVAGFVADAAGRDPGLGERVASLLRSAPASAGGVTTELVRRLEKESPDAFAALLAEAYKGYYSRPDIRAGLGVGAHPAHPRGHDVAPDPPGLIDELTAPVRARGPVFRDPTGGAA